MRLGDWCWSTRSDIDPMEMYLFDPYVQEPLEGPVGEYVAVCHAGHGANSYGLNFHLVHGGVGWFVQHGWGGAYMDPVVTRTAMAFTYAVLDELIDGIEPRPVSARVDYVVACSALREVRAFHTREPTGEGFGDSGGAEAPWSCREFPSEQALLTFAADALCPDRAAGLSSSMRAASGG
ncbi:MAG: hypothetical protein KDB35_05945 [Acidimicrobiales bacterium]|nr:hypothetical protein [Acidimicrobiales bacterium]